MDNENLDQMEFEKQEAEDLINKLKNQNFRNREARIEFANIILQLAANMHPVARRLIWKTSEFIKYWETDEMIDENEWRKLNNTDNIQEEVIFKYKKRFN